MVAEYVLGLRWRGDNFKNYWHYDGPLKRDGDPMCPGEKRYWRTRSERTVERFYRDCNILTGLADFVKDHRRANTKVWRELSKYKKLREATHHSVTEPTPITFLAFKRIMKDNHKDFAPLRGGKRVKVV